MAIEPLGSAMTYQAQGTQKVEPTRTTENNNREVITEGTMSPVDNTTQSVQKSEKSGNTDENGNHQDNQSQNQPSNDKIKQAVEDLNRKMKNSEAVFGIHEKTNRVTIKIIDKETKKLIKEYPPEKTLDMIAKAWELAGIMVDEKR
ncbi:MAG: flagellar protein FlaG [Lachnospiraceae bacterium]|nr:flagellar protein FlaG [Lachnospiraceae bacterium]